MDNTAYFNIIMTSFFQRYPISVWPIFCAGVILLLLALGLDVRNALRLDLQLTAHGQWWRMLTAHWVHLGWYHGLLNASGFLLIAWMQPKGHWFKWLAFYLLTSVCISAFLLTEQNLTSYVGASGVLHGLIILAAFYSSWLELWRKIMMIVAISAKLLWEQSAWYDDATVHALIGGNVAVNAHLVGGLCGLFIVFIALTNNYRISKYHK